MENQFKQLLLSSSQPSHQGRRFIYFAKCCHSFFDNIVAVKSVMEESGRLTV